MHLPILWIARSDSGFERYVIEDSHEQVWNGKEFGTGDGLLFAHYQEAAAETQRILKSHFKGVEPTKLVVPLYVEVYGGEEIPVESVVKYLSKASKLTVDTGTHGNGPDQSLVLTRIEWGEIEPVEEAAND